MIFIKTDENGLADIYYKPFDDKDGLGKSREQLELEGILVDSIPEPEHIEGKIPFLYGNQTTKELWYEYEELSPTTEDEIGELKQENISLKMALIEQDIQTSNEITALKLAVLELDMALENLKEAN